MSISAPRPGSKWSARFCARNPRPTRRSWMRPTSPGEGNRLTTGPQIHPRSGGIRTAWYAVQPKASQIGFAITPLSAEKHIQGKVEPAAAPATNYLKFEPQSGLLPACSTRPTRERWWKWCWPLPHAPKLDRQTQAFSSDPALCAQVPSQACVVIPKRVALNPFLAITVNGSEATIPVGSTVGAAIRLSACRRISRCTSFMPEEPCPWSSTGPAPRSWVWC